MNFISEYKKGQQGDNFGLPMGIEPLEKSLDGIQKKTIYTIASSPKVGKSTLVDYCFLLSPYLYSLEHSEIEIDWNYYSFEIDRIKKEFKIAAFFMYHDYNQFSFSWKDGETYLISPRYLTGRLKDKDGHFIPVSDEHSEMLKKIYSDRIVPLFGKYSVNGIKMEKGVINFVEQKNNPTGIRNDLLFYAEKNGKFIKEQYQTKDENNSFVKRERIVGYIANNPKKIVINIIDHIRLLRLERGYQMKQNIDKMSQYEVELRNYCNYIFVNVVHLNRSIAAVDRMKYMSASLFPTADDIKDSGNLSEDSDVIITLFNPNDEKYNLTEHFGYKCKDIPNYRSIHVVESRDTFCPEHFFCNMYGNVNVFEPLQ